MKPSEYAQFLDAEAKLTIGDTVSIRWTSCYRTWEGQGPIQKINAKSILVKLNAAVGDPVRDYPAGHIIKAPRFINRQWSQYNRIVTV